MADPHRRYPAHSGSPVNSLVNSDVDRVQPILACSFKCLVSDAVNSVSDLASTTAKESFTPVCDNFLSNVLNQCILENNICLNSDNVSTDPVLLDGNQPFRERGKLNVLYTNCDVLTTKKEELIARISISKPDVIALTEIFPKNVHKDFPIQPIELQLPGYQLFLPPCSKGDSCRGVVLYLRNGINGSLVEVDEGNFAESVWLRIREDNFDLLFGCVYRSPSSDTTNNAYLNSLIEKACALNAAQLVIVGDFNYKDIDWERNIRTGGVNDSQLFLECLDDHFICQHVKEPTRFRDGQIPSLLDLVLTNSQDIVDGVMIGPPLGRSDHVTLIFEIDGMPAKTVDEPLSRSYYHGDYDKMRSMLKKIDWYTKLNDISGAEAWDIFEDTLNDCIEVCVPLKRRKSKESAEWMTQKALNAVKEKRKAWSKYIKSKNMHKSDEQQLWKEYKKARNHASSQAREAKDGFENKLAEEVKINDKSFWRYVRKQTRSRSGIPDLCSVDGTLLKDDIEKAEALNEYFASVYCNEDLSTIPDMAPRCDDHISDIVFTTDNIDTLLQNVDISKAAGPDGIHSRVLKEAHAEVAQPLQIIFTKLLSEGKVPLKWKQAIVVPVHKKGKKDDPANYRPISLTSIVCKIMEKIVRKQLLQHLENNNLLSDDQHGFRSGRSCATQLLEVLEVWTDNHDRGLSFDCIYLDYRKAFDSVPHQRLLRKVEAYGVEGHLLAWLRDYLTGRSQRVKVNEALSSSADVTSGIPQGSVLGPTLFILFINDLPPSVQSEMKLFADDTKLYRTIRTSQDSEQLQADLDTATKWSKEWQLPFNKSKCKTVNYGRKNPRHKYLMEGEHGKLQIESVKEEKDLGVLFQENLTFSAHAANAAKRANIKLGMIKRSFRGFRKKGFLRTYKSIIRPTLEYCNQVWHPMYKKDEDMLEKVQQRATRLVAEIRHLEYSERLRVLQLPTLAYRRQRADLIQIFKILKGFDNIDASQFFKLAENSSTRGHSLKIYKQRCHTQLRLMAFSMRSIKNWNALPDEIVRASSVNQFKNALEKFWANHPLKFAPYLR